ncbi:MAG: glycosyltransferase [Sphingobium sp.]
MKILHITAHLGGGVGKAHSALCAMDGPEVERHFLLLEPPRDTRYADAIRATGATVGIADDAASVRRLVASADIVQIEWWNHPRLYEGLCRFDLPESRTVLWSHISGLFAPYVPRDLLTAPHRFLFTSACSLDGPLVQALPADARAQMGIINSGFGFHGPAGERPASDAVAYLGTVDFAKMSRLFFDVVERAELKSPVSIWGAVERDGEVLRRAAAMQRPEAVRFHGQADDPESVLRQAGIFLYLLQPRHFGTAENALIEAMSLGCVPIVFDNPAERAIVDHGQTGFVENSVDAAAERLRWLVDNPAIRAAMGQRAADSVAATRSVAQASADFAATYRAVMAMDKRRIDYAAILGATPADWFLSTQGETISAAAGHSMSAHKGTLAHFSQCFPDDPSLKALLPGV